MKIDFKFMFVNGSALEFTCDNWLIDNTTLNLWTTDNDGNIKSNLYIPLSNVLWWRKTIPGFSIGTIK